MRNTMRDCKVILGESLVSQHRLLLAEFVLSSNRPTGPKVKAQEKIKWHKLSESQQFIDLMKEWLLDILEAAEDLSLDELWYSFEQVCTEKAKQFLGVSKGRLNIGKEAWWWNNEVATATIYLYTKFINVEKYLIVIVENMNKVHFHSSFQSKEAEIILKVHLLY
uniref:CSON012838 protein n=1 Tax=Culicoides sonorensis TaxID=179676 RepID=A0A336KNE4_CULSO